MFKKIIICIVVMLSFTSIVIADDIEENDYKEGEIQELIIESAATPTDEPKINARYAIIYDRTTKQMMWGKKKMRKCQWHQRQR